MYYYKKDELNLQNCSYDYNSLKLIYDTNFRYNIILDHHLLYRYKIQKILGKGAYSNVVKCLDYKKIKNMLLKLELTNLNLKNH